MAATVNNDTQSIVVGSGNDRVAINLKQAQTVSIMSFERMKCISLFLKNQTESLLLTSIVIEMGDIEIQIRRSTKSAESLPTSLKSSALVYQNGKEEKKNTTNEKPASNQPSWDYSISNGKIFLSLSLP